MRTALFIALPVAIVAAVALGAYLVVAGDDDKPDLSAIRTEPGRVSCEMFQVARGYRFEARVQIDLKDRPPEITPVPGEEYRDEGIIQTNELTGAVKGVEAFYVNNLYVEEPVRQEYIVIGETFYNSTDGEPWTTKPLSESGITISYIPGAACNGIAPDLFLSDLQGVPEEVNGIPAVRYHFDNLETDLPDRDPSSFGPQSDVARFVNNFEGDVWVAEEGKYVIKMDLFGRGEYPNGRVLEVSWSYELSDVNAKVEINPPI
jgi:hypothetical protein